MPASIIEGEQWKAIPGYEGRYSVSNLGRVMSHLACRGTTSRIMTPNPYRKGYLQVTLMRDGRQRPGKVHRLVLMAFVGVDPSRPLVNHKNGIVTDNALSNLEWCTHSENLLHAFRVLGKDTSKLGARGILNANAKLCDAKVVELRRMHAGGASIRAVARLVGMSRKTIAMMLRRESWRHVA